jgi:small subunit ribosomal protein S17
MARKLSGIVTSDKGDKTIVVTVTRRETHPIYGKSYLVSKKFAAHDEKNEAKKGDKVIIVETKPISKSKSFVLETITERGHENVEIRKTEVEQEIDEKLAAKAEKKAAEKAVETEKPEEAEK